MYEQISFYSKEIKGECFKTQKTMYIHTSMKRSFYISVAFEEVMHTLNSG